MYNFINDYGKIIYVINAEIKKITISFVKVKLNKTNLKNTYYIEALNKIQNAESILLEFNLRNNKYIYKLK